MRARRIEGPLLRRHYPTSTLIRPCPIPAMAAACRDVEAATLARDGLPRLPEPPFRRAVTTTPADREGARVDCFPARAAFPKWQEGRHPHRHFRGLLRLHSRCGPPDRAASEGDLCHEAPALPVTRPSRSSATRSIPPPLVLRAVGAHSKSGSTLHAEAHPEQEADNSRATEGGQLPVTNMDVSPRWRMVVGRVI